MNAQIHDVENILPNRIATKVPTDAKQATPTQSKPKERYYNVHIDISTVKEPDITMQRAIVQSFSKYIAGYCKNKLENGELYPQVTIHPGISRIYVEFPFNLAKVTSSISITECNCKFSFYTFVNESESNCEMFDQDIISYTRYELPNPRFEGVWYSLQFEENIKSQLLTYFRLFSRSNTPSLSINSLCETPPRSSLSVSQQHLAPSSLSHLNRFILLKGPPGTGKTSLAMSLPQIFTIRAAVDSRHGAQVFDQAFLVHIHLHSILSKWYGESAKQLQTVFDYFIQLARDSPTVIWYILLDEIETIASSRSNTNPPQQGNKNNTNSTSSTNGESVNVVTILLQILDSVRRDNLSNIFFIGTTNTEHIDPAIVDRADITLEIGQPVIKTRYNILNQLVTQFCNENLLTQSLCFGRGFMAQYTQLMLQTAMKSPGGSICSHLVNKSNDIVAQILSLPQLLALCPPLKQALQAYDDQVRFVHTYNSLPYHMQVNHYSDNNNKVSSASSSLPRQAPSEPVAGLPLEDDILPYANKRKRSTTSRSDENSSFTRQEPCLCRETCQLLSIISACLCACSQAIIKRVKIDISQNPFSCQARSYSHFHHPCQSHSSSSSSKQTHTDPKCIMGLDTCQCIANSQLSMAGHFCPCFIISLLLLRSAIFTGDISPRSLGKMMLQSVAAVETMRQEPPITHPMTRISGLETPSVRTMMADDSLSKIIVNQSITAVSPKHDIMCQCTAHNNPGFKSGSSSKGQGPPLACLESFFAAYMQSLEQNLQYKAPSHSRY